MDILRLGLRWRVGNGNSIKVFKDRWMTSPTTFKVEYRHQAISEDLMVRDLIEPALGNWNVGMIESLFSPRDVREILKIPISPLLPEDKCVWHYSPNGEYTVKSGYWVAAELKREQRGNSSNGCRLGSKVWK